MNRAVVALCLIIFGNTFSIGAFPVLIPEISRTLAIGDFALGALAGAFGFARVLADLPSGLFITHHLRKALVMGAIAVTVGVLCLGAGGPYGLLLAGRALCGVGHALFMLGGITAIVRYAPPSSRVLCLNAFEMSAMCGVLCGILAAGFLPNDWAWNWTLLAASTPQFLCLALLPLIVRSLPAGEAAGVARRLFSRGEQAQAGGDTASLRHAVGIAFITGFVIAIAWSSIGQFILPIRASRDFGLDRDGVALLLSIPQVVDVCLLLPLGMLADRTSHARALAIIMLILAAGVLTVAFGTLSMAIVGCVLFGIGLAAWMLPVSLLNQNSPQTGVSWRTALYRTCVDLGVFLGPILSGLLAQKGVLWILPSVTAVALALISARLFRRL